MSKRYSERVLYLVYFLIYLSNTFLLYFHVLINFSVNSWNNLIKDFILDSSWFLFFINIFQLHDIKEFIHFSILIKIDQVISFPFVLWKLFGFLGQVDSKMLHLVLCFSLSSSHMKISYEIFNIFTFFSQKFEHNHCECYRNWQRVRLHDFWNTHSWRF